MPEKVAMLLSGGYDSLTLATDIIKNPERYRTDSIPKLFHFTDNDPLHQFITKKVQTEQQKWLSNIAKKDVHIDVINVDGMLLSGKFEKPRSLYIPAGIASIEDQPHTVGRQVLFVTIAFNHMAYEKITRLYTAFQMEESRWDNFNDGGSYSDDDPSFVESINELCWIGGGYVPEQEIIAPFLDERLSKVDIFRRGIKLGVPADTSYTCVFQFPNPCNVCNACYIHNYGCAELGYDPRKVDNEE